MSAMDMEVLITEESGEQVLRIPPAFRLSSSRVHLHRDSADGPITLSPQRNHELAPALRQQRLRELFGAVDAARESGETFEIERECRPTLKEIFAQFDALDLSDFELERDHSLPREINL